MSDDTLDEKALTDMNIKSIEKDTQRIRTASRPAINDLVEDDIDDLSKYTNEDDGVKVLQDTTSINRKAIFHDLNRLKHWRQSMDQSKPEKNEKEIDDLPEKEPVFTPIMESNMDLILNSMPDVKVDDEGGDESNEKAAIEKLNIIEKKLSKQYSMT